MLHVHQIMSEEVVTIDENQTIHEAAELMAKEDVGSLLVSKNGVTVGIVTERDFTRKLLANHRSGRELIRAVMSKPIHYSSPDADIIEAANMLKANDIKKLPVIRGEQLIGVVTQTDIIRHIFDTIKSIENAYQEGTITSQQFAQQSSKLFKNFSSTLDGLTKQWHMRCNDCNKAFLSAEYDGELELQKCPACGSRHISYDQNPDL